MGKESEDGYGDGPLWERREIFAMADETTTIVSSVFIPPKEIDFTRVARLGLSHVELSRASMFPADRESFLSSLSLSLFLSFSFSPGDCYAA